MDPFEDWDFEFEDNALDVAALLEGEASSFRDEPILSEAEIDRMAALEDEEDDGGGDDDDEEEDEEEEDDESRARSAAGAGAGAGAVGGTSGGGVAVARVAGNGGAVADLPSSSPCVLGDGGASARSAGASSGAPSAYAADLSTPLAPLAPLPSPDGLFSPDLRSSTPAPAHAAQRPFAPLSARRPKTPHDEYSLFLRSVFGASAGEAGGGSRGAWSDATGGAGAGTASAPVAPHSGGVHGVQTPGEPATADGAWDAGRAPAGTSVVARPPSFDASRGLEASREGAALAAFDASRRASLRFSSHSLDPRTLASASAAAAAIPCSPGLALSGSLPALDSLDAARTPLSTPSADATPAPTLPQPAPFALTLPTPPSAHPLANAASAPSAAAASVPAALLADLGPSPGDVPATKKAGTDAGEDSEDDPDDADWVAQWQSDEDEGEGGEDDESWDEEGSPKNGRRGDRGAGTSGRDASGTRRAAGKRASAKQVRQRGGNASLDGGAVAGGPPPAGGKRGRVGEARSGEGLPTPQRRRLATVYGAPPLPSASPPRGPPSAGGGPLSQDAATSSGADAAATGALSAGASPGSQMRPTAAPPASSGPRLRPSSRLPPALAAALRPQPKGPPGALTPADYAAIARQTASHVQLLLQGAALGLAVRGPGAARARRAAAASARLCLALRAVAGGRAAARRDVGIPGYNAEAIHLGWVGAGVIADGEEGGPLGEAGAGQGTTTGAGEAAYGRSELGGDARGQSHEPIVPFPLLRDPTYSILDAALFDEAPRFLRAVQAAARAGAGADDEPADGPADPGTSGSGAAGAGQGRGPGASGPGASRSGRTALQASRRLAAASSRPPLPPASSSTLSAPVRAPRSSSSSSSSLPLASSSPPPPPPPPSSSSSSSSSSNAPGHVAWRHLPRPVRVEWDRLSSLRLTSAGLEPSPPPHARWNLRLFTPAEDALLAIGIRRFAFDWEAIASTLLPGKSAEQARVRRKNLAALKPLRKPLHPGAVAVREASDRLLRPLSDAEIALLQAFAPKLEGVKGRWEALCATAFAERDPNVTARLWAAHLDQRGAGGRAKAKARRGKAKGTAGGAGQWGPRHDDATAATDAERDAGTGLGMGDGDATRRAAKGRAGGGGGGGGGGCTDHVVAAIAATGGLAPTDVSACVGTDAAVSDRAFASAIDRSGAALASIPLPPASLLPSLATPSTGGSPASSPRSDGPAASLFPPAPSSDPSSSSPPALPAHAIRDAGVRAPTSSSGPGLGAASPASSPPPSPSTRERHLRRRRELAAMRRRGPIRAAFLAMGGGGGEEEEGEGEGEEEEEEGEGEGEEEEEEGGRRGVESSRGGRWGLEVDESGPGRGSASGAATSGVASTSGGAAETLSQRPLGRSRASQRELPETSPLGPEPPEASLTPMPAHAAFLRTPGEFPSPSPSAFGSQIASGIDGIGGIGGGGAGGGGIAGGLPSDSPLSPVRLSSPGSLPSPVHLASPGAAFTGAAFTGENSALHALFSPANVALERGADASATLPSLQTPLGAASQRFSTPGGVPLQPQLGASLQRFAPVAAPLQHLAAHGTIPSQPHLAAPGGVPPQAGFPAQLGAFPAAPSGARASSSFVSASYYTSSSTAAPTAPPPSSLVPISSLSSLSATVGVGAASGALPAPALPSTPWPARHYERVELSSSSEDEADRDEEKSRATPGTSTLAQRRTRVEARTRAGEDKGPPAADHRPPSAAIGTRLLPPEEQRTPVSNAAALAPFLTLSPEATPSFDPPPATAGAHPAQAPVPVPVSVPASIPASIPASVPAPAPAPVPVPVPAPVSALTAFSREQDRRMLRAVVARNGLLSRADLAALAADVQAPQDRVSERCKQLVARLEARAKA